LGDVDRNLGSIKLKIPAFKGKIDPEAYLDWEKKVKMILTSIGKVFKPGPVKALVPGFDQVTRVNSDFF
jgi:hypothetical protein